MATQNLLRINSSGRYHGSLTRQVSERVVNQLQQADPSVKSVERDLANGMPFVNEQWINANFTASEERSAEQKEILDYSDSLVAELQQADHIVIASPIYNFGIPAVLKAWVDLVARARLTFKYTENGPVGLLEGKKATVVMASGGVPIGSEMDTASKYLIQVLAFIGITDVTVIDATKVDLDAEQGLLV